MSQQAAQRSPCRRKTVHAATQTNPVVWAYSHLKSFLQGSYPSTLHNPQPRLPRRYSLAIPSLTLIVAKMGNNSDFETGLRTLFTRVFGDSQSLDAFKRLSGGASQETWALSNSSHSSILRRAPGGTSMARSSAAIDLPAEAKERLLALTPSSYIGLATEFTNELAERIKNQNK